MSLRKGKQVVVSAETLAEVNAIRSRGVAIGGVGSVKDQGKEHPIVDEIRAGMAGLEDFKEQQAKEVADLSATVKDLSARLAMADLGGVGTRGSSLTERQERENFAHFCRGKIKAGMSTDSGPDGGYLVPTEVEKGISRLAVDLSPMRRIARVVSTTTSSYKKVVSTNATTGAWTTEKASRSQTQGLQLSELEFHVHELTAMPAVTQTLLDDAATDVAAEVSFEIAQAFELMESAAFVSGDGVNKPRGFLSHTMVANGSWAWGKIGYLKSGVAAALSDSTHNGLDALNSLLYSLKSEYRRNATWLMNSNTAATVSQLKNDSGDYLWQPPVQLGQPASLYGRPVEIDENMPDVGADLFPIALGDFTRGYLIVDRIGVRVLRDPYSSKPYVQFYTTKRVGGNVQDFAAIKVLKIAA